MQLMCDLKWVEDELKGCIEKAASASGDEQKKQVSRATNLLTQARKLGMDGDKCNEIDNEIKKHQKNLTTDIFARGADVDENSQDI
jgi:ElaB/YqjD/DUF883 family membrane-anchored ribosome-binding protein